MRPWVSLELNPELTGTQDQNCQLLVQKMARFECWAQWEPEEDIFTGQSLKIFLKSELSLPDNQIELFENKLKVYYCSKT